jgi:stage V sporulation protein SpoVS
MTRLVESFLGVRESSVSDSNDLVALKVSARTEPRRTAGAMAKLRQEGTPFRVEAVGAGASHQMLKAMILAQGMVAENGESVTWSLCFEDTFLKRDGIAGSLIAAKPVFR